MMLLDANVIMYAAGAPHAFKAPSAAVLVRVANGDVEAAIDAEVLQEILYRYRYIRRWERGEAVYRLARKVVPVVIPITAEMTDTACELLSTVPRLGARDALHAAVCLTSGATSICSYDRAFDLVPGVHRITP